MSVNSNYKTLGLQSDATWDEVKSAFRRLARTYHPDVAGPEGARKFAEITEAYMLLKESISPGVTGRAAPGSAARNRGSAKRDVSESGRKDSIFKVFWQKLFGKKEKRQADEQEYEDVIPPARVRFISSVISRAESEMHTLLSRRSEIKSKNMMEAILRRIKSRHPGVVLLAMQRIRRNGENAELRRAIVEHFEKIMPTAEVLEALLVLFGTAGRQADAAKMLARHAVGYSPGDAMMIIRWLKRQSLGADYIVPFFHHPLNSVIAAALNSWPQNSSLPDSVDCLALIKRDDEILLVPLLRLLKREKISPWLAQTITKMASSHKSPVVRVWASAIVRDQHLG